MISYVECLGGDAAGHGVATRCWNGEDEERDELLPRKMAALHPKTEGSLRRRLLSARIHQRYDAIMAVNGGVRMEPAAAAGDRKPLPPQCPSPGPSPWYRHQHFPPRAPVHPSLPPEAHGKLFSAPDVHGKPLQAPPCGGGARRGLAPPLGPPPDGAPAIGGHEAPPRRRRRPRGSGLLCLRPRRGRKSGMAASQATPLLSEGTSWFLLMWMRSLVMTA